MTKCLFCSKSFIPRKNKSTIGCPACVKRTSEKVKRDIENKKKYKCIRCGSKFIPKKNKSTIACYSCTKDIRDGECWDMSERINSRFEILDL